MTSIFKTSVVLFDQLLIHLKEQESHSLIPLVLVIYLTHYDADRGTGHQRRT